MKFDPDLKTIEKFMKTKQKQISRPLELASDTFWFLVDISKTVPDPRHIDEITESSMYIPSGETDPNPYLSDDDFNGEQKPINDDFDYKKIEPLPNTAEGKSIKQQLINMRCYSIEEAILQFYKQYRKSEKKGKKS